MALVTGVKKIAVFKQWQIFVKEQPDVWHITLKFHPGHAENKMMGCIFFTQNK